jgi:HSP20 family protein
MRHDLDTRNCSTATRSGDWALPTVGDLFQSFFAPVHAAQGPALDVTETGEGYEVTADVPGFSMDQIGVQFDNNVLTLTGEHAEKAEQTDRTDDGVRWHVVERTRSSFTRSIKFPAAVDATGIKAALKNGVLTISLPKAAAAKAQKIKITQS